MYEDVRTLYESRGFGGRVGFGARPALVVIDLARSWLDESSPLGSTRLKTVVDNVVTILSVTRQFGHPVFFTTMSYDDSDVAGPLGKKLLAAEPRAIQFSMSYMNGWAQNFSEVVNGEFRTEMRKRGKQI